MRFKVAPEPVDADLLAAVHGAIPLVPGSVDDCCARILDRTAVDSRSAAEDWLTFCRALELATETDRGYERRRRDPTADAACEAARGTVPNWERNRHTDWEAVWTERTRRLLDWGVAFGRVERTDAGYRPV